MYIVVRIYITLNVRVRSDEWEKGQWLCPVLRFCYGKLLEKLKNHIFYKAKKNVIQCRIKVNGCLSPYSRQVFTGLASYGA
jgi:hypothetical protein